MLLLEKSKITNQGWHPFSLYIYLLEKSLVFTESLLISYHTLISDEHFIKPLDVFILKTMRF